MQVFINVCDVKYDTVGCAKLHAKSFQLFFIIMSLQIYELEHRICDKTFNERHPVPSLNRAPIQNRDIFLKDIRKFIFFQMACYAFKSINVLCLISAPKVILIAMKM